jgi:hypothetical protein
MMKSAVLILGAAALATATDGDCFANTKQADCSKSTESGESCVWCSSAAVGDSCFKESDAEGLPTSVFRCEFPALAGTEECTTHTSEKDCMSSSEGSETCAWCTSGAVGNSCFKHSDAEGLPSSVFRCSYQDAYGVQAEPECTTHTSEKDCMSSTEGAETCAWCTSGAVGNSCFKTSDAQGLPSSVFRCEYQSAYGLGAEECTVHTSEKECMSSTEGEEACSWCTSGAVGNTCFKESDAKGLPSSVFRCEYQTAYGFAADPECTTHTSEKSCMSSVEGAETCAWCTSGAVGNSCFKTSDAQGLPSSVFRCEYQTWYEGLFNVAMNFLGF